MSFLERLKRLLGGEPGRPGGEEDPSADRDGNGACGGRPPISCAEALERLQEFLDGELEDVAAAEVAHHFRVCKACFPHLRLEERFRQALRESQKGEVCPERVRARLMDLLTAETGEGT
jgi:anti-sigma factor (TIGR02949 family)